MPKQGEQAVGNLWKSLVEALGLSTLSTDNSIYLTSQALFRHSLFTVRAFQTPTHSQALSAIINLLGPGFYTVSTVPMNTTNLIRK